MDWTMKGTVLIGCNCAYGCPCNFNALPTDGFCEGEWTWHIDAGSAGGTDLSGLTFTLAVKWPGAIHEGDGEGILFVDEQTDDAQTDAIHTVVKGGHGGPWGVIGWTYPTLHGPQPVPFELNIDGIRSSVVAGDGFEMGFEPIANPKTGAEITPGAVLPQGLVFNEGTFASLTRLRVDQLGMDYEGTYAAVAPYEYAGS